MLNALTSAKKADDEKTNAKPVDGDMPAFKDTLSRDDIWAVIAYIQARLPQKAK